MHYCVLGACLCGVSAYHCAHVECKYCHKLICAIWLPFLSHLGSTERATLQGTPSPSWSLRLCLGRLVRRVTQLSLYQGAFVQHVAVAVFLCVYIHTFYVRMWFVLLRPGLIGPHSTSGEGNKKDVLYWLVHAAAEMGVVPTGPVCRETPLHLAPVDYVAEAITALSLGKCQGEVSSVAFCDRILKCRECHYDIRTLGTVIECHTLE